MKKTVIACLFFSIWFLPVAHADEEPQQKIEVNQYGDIRRSKQSYHWKDITREAKQAKEQPGAYISFGVNKVIKMEQTDWFHHRIIRKYGKAIFYTKGGDIQAVNKTQSVRGDLEIIYPNIFLALAAMAMFVAFFFSFFKGSQDIIAVFILTMLMGIIFVMIMSYGNLQYSWWTLFLMFLGGAGYFAFLADCYHVDHANEKAMRKTVPIAALFFTPCFLWAFFGPWFNL